MNVDKTKSHVNGLSWMLCYNFDFWRRCNTVVSWHDNPENEFHFKTSCLFWLFNTLRRQVLIINFKFLMASPSELSYSSGFAYTLLIALDWFPSYFIQKPTRVLMSTLNAIDLLNNDVNNALAARTCIVVVVVMNESNMASYFPEAGNLKGRSADMCSDAAGPSRSCSELSDMSNTTYFYY